MDVSKPRSRTLPITVIDSGKPAAQEAGEHHHEHADD